jgi:signal transduction histidine kinase
VIALVVFSIAALHELRIRQHAIREKELAAIVAKRTQHLEEALKSMETFTYSMAHDLRAPLRAIHGMLRILFDEYGGHFDATARDYANRIREAATRMDDLIRDLLIYGQISHSKTPMQKVNLERTLEKVRAECEPQASAKHGVIEIAKSESDVIANPLLLEQVLTNIVCNGLKFVPPEKSPHVRIWAESQKDKVRIVVEDNGIGIEHQYQQRIFGLFERLHHQGNYPGTGVGLAIVQKGAERMGGRVGVESEQGKGSRFWLELPAAN